MSGDEGADASQQSSGQESAQFLATEIKVFLALTPGMTQIRCRFVGNVGSDRLTYIYGQKGSQWIRRK